MIHSYAARKTTEEAMQENLHVAPAEFDKEFLRGLSRKPPTPSSILTIGKRHESAA